MTVESVILSELGVIVTRVTGTPGFQEIRQHQRSLASDPEFDPDFHHLFDLSQVQDLRITTEEIRELASSGVFSPSSRRAVVAPRDAMFGLSRMYEGFSHLPEGAVRVFRNPEEAIRWLGMDEKSSG